MSILRREVKTVYIPGEPAVPPVPPTCTTTRKRVLSSGDSSTGSGGQFIPIQGTVSNPLSPGDTTGTIGYIDTRTGTTTAVEDIPAIYGGGSGGVRISGGSATNSTYTSRTETVCYGGSPGKPGTPGRVEKLESGPDWKASARSVDRRAGDMVANFYLNDTPTVAVGLGTNDTGAAFGDLLMGVLLKTSGVTTVVAPIVNGIEQTAVANFNPGDMVSLVRANGRFKIQVGGDNVYDTAAVSNDAVFLDAMLYTSSDYVQDASFAPVVSVAVTGNVGFKAGLSTQTGVEGVVGLSGVANTLVDGVALVPTYGNVGFTASANSVLSADVGVSGKVGLSADLTKLSTYAEADLQLPALEVLASDSTYAQLVSTLPALSLDGSIGAPEVNVAGADLTLPTFGFYSRWFAGSTLSMTDAPLPSLEVFAAESEHTRVVSTLPALRFYADDGFDAPGYGTHVENVVLADTIYTDPTLYASITEGIELDPTLSLTILVDGSYYDGMLLDPTLSPEMFLEAMIESGITLSSATQAPVDLLSQYAFDLDTGAATRYDGFEFGGFTFTGDATYAFKKDGIYKLRAGDDDGQPRNFMLDLGTTDFGTTAKKHIETAFIGLSTDGTVYLKLNADQRGERIYRVIQRDPLMRARVGRGITARQWHAKLEVVDGRSAELDGVEFHVAASARRWVK